MKTWITVVIAVLITLVILASIGIFVWTYWSRTGDEAGAIQIFEGLS